MPVGSVKTVRDERLWAKAKAIAAREGHAEDWPYIQGIYQRMRKSLVFGAVCLELAKAKKKRPQGDLFGPHGGGWHRAPKSKKGRERRWVPGRGWEYRDAIGAHGPDGDSSEGEDTGTRSPLVRLGMTLSEAESSIRSAEVEHFAIVGPDGRVRDGAQGTRSYVVIPEDTSEALMSSWSGGYVFTHNHPSSRSLSEEDMLFAVRHGLLAIRSVGSVGNTCELRFSGVPEEPYSDEDWFALRNIISLRWNSGLNKARDTMTEVIYEAGGSPSDGEDAVGYDDAKFRAYIAYYTLRDITEGLQSLGLGTTFVYTDKGGKTHEDWKDIATAIYHDRTSGDPDPAFGGELRSGRREFP